MCWWVGLITFFVIFAVLDVSFAVNSCLNRSFFYIYLHFTLYKTMKANNNECEGQIFNFSDAFLYVVQKA